MPEPPVVLVTGASRGLGRGIAVRLAELGMSVVLNYAGNARAARETEQQCRSAAEPPFTPRGCVAQAWSVAEVLRCLLKTAR